MRVGVPNVWRIALIDFFELDDAKNSLNSSGSPTSIVYATKELHVAQPILRGGVSPVFDVRVFVAYCTDAEDRSVQAELYPFLSCLTPGFAITGRKGFNWRLRNQYRHQSVGSPRLRRISLRTTRQFFKASFASSRSAQSPGYLNRTP